MQERLAKHANSIILCGESCITQGQWRCSQSAPLPLPQQCLYRWSMESMYNRHTLPASTQFNSQNGYNGTIKPCCSQCAHSLTQRTQGSAMHPPKGPEGNPAARVSWMDGAAALYQPRTTCCLRRLTVCLCMKATLMLCAQKRQHRQTAAQFLQANLTIVLPASLWMTVQTTAIAHQV